MTTLFINGNGTQTEREASPHVHENNPHRAYGGQGAVNTDTKSNYSVYTGSTGDISGELDDYKLRSGVYPHSP
jgi:hypothetical protein